MVAVVVVVVIDGVVAVLAELRDSAGVLGSPAASDTLCSDRSLSHTTSDTHNAGALACLVSVARRRRRRVSPRPAAAVVVVAVVDVVGIGASSTPALLALRRSRVAGLPSTTVATTGVKTAPACDTHVSHVRCAWRVAAHDRSTPRSPAARRCCSQTVTTITPCVRTRTSVIDRRRR